MEHYSPGGTNWAAYTHEELHGMLWEDADVADVSAVADEWGRHSEALSDHATALRKQQAALRSDWQGEAAEVAASRLGTLADRIDEISVGAAARQRAAQDAGNALALARAMMPPPAGPGMLAATGGSGGPGATGGSGAAGQSGAVGQSGALGGQGGPGELGRPGVSGAAGPSGGPGVDGFGSAGGPGGSSPGAPGWSGAASADGFGSAGSPAPSGVPGVPGVDGFGSAGGPGGSSSGVLGSPSAPDWSGVASADGFGSASAPGWSGVPSADGFGSVGVPGAADFGLPGVDGFGLSGSPGAAGFAPPSGAEFGLAGAPGLPGTAGLASPDWSGAASADGFGSASAPDWSGAASADGFGSAGVPGAADFGSPAVDGFGLLGVPAWAGPSWAEVPGAADFGAASVPEVPGVGTFEAPVIPSWTPAPVGDFGMSGAPSWYQTEGAGGYGPPSLPPADGTTWFATFGAPPTTGFGAVATGGSSMFYGNAAAEQAKAQAVYTLRVYEASLRDGGDLVATHAARTYGTGQSTIAQPPIGLPDGPRTGGVPWERLVSPLRPGTAVGVGAIAAGGVPASIGGAAPESAVARASQQGGLMPPVGSRGAGADEEPHVNRMPVIDQGLFIVETPTSAPVIGVVT